MKERLFRFKKFSVHHSQSAMKVGVDGVLTGAWCDISESRLIIDAGAGCGLIALMCAQRNPEALIAAIEIDDVAAEEARLNIDESPWPDRVRVIVDDILANRELCSGADHIVSNPPYFDSGVSTITTRRELARHGAALSPATLIEIASETLAPEGRLSMIFPAEQLASLNETAASFKLWPRRICLVRGHENTTFKRAMCEYRRSEGECIRRELTLETSPGVPTEEYRELCRDFYLKF